MVILRHSIRSRPQLCPRCKLRAIEAGDNWEAFEAADIEDRAAALPLCLVCVTGIDERIRIALDVLNLGPIVELRPGDRMEVPF
jgi:hypothetical protein